MAVKFTRLTHKRAIQLHLMAEGCTIRSPKTFGYTFVLGENKTDSARMWGNGGGGGLNPQPPL